MNTLSREVFVHEVEDDEGGRVRLLGQPIRLSESHVEMEAAPALGKHTGAVVAADLGISAVEVADLKAAGAFG